MTDKWTYQEEDQARQDEAAYWASPEGQERKKLVPGICGFQQQLERNAEVEGK